MPQDFSGQNLRGRSFKGQDLSGANFSNADIRGADFSNTKLIGANFSGAHAGLQQHWVARLLVCSWILAGFSGYFSTVVGGLVTYVLKPVNQESFIVGIVSLITLVIFFIVIFRKGLVAGAVAVALAFSFAVAAAFSFVYAGSAAIALAFSFAVAAAVAITVAVAGAITGATRAVTVAGAFAVAGAFFGGGGFVVTGVIAVAFTLTSAYIGLLGWAGDKRFALVRLFAVAFAAIGGTSFRGANLSNANFTQARLKSTDIRGAIITRTCWHTTKMLDRVRLGTTYLQHPQLQQVLVTGLGQDNNFDRQNLRGVNLQGANLADASFIGTDLSAASLQDADLSRAKLVKTQLDETDLTGVTLTGACIQDWGITTNTKLNGVRCEYIFMRYVEPKDLDENRRRKPDNWEEKFEDGDFADFIKPIVDTLDLYHNQGVDPREIAIAFKQLAENNPDAEIRIVGIEVRGEKKKKFLLRAKTTVTANKSKLSAEYFNNYNQIKGLPEGAKLLLTEKDNQIRSLKEMFETALKTSALNPSNVYSETHIHKVETMSNNSGGFSVGGSVGGNANNVQGDNNRIVQGDDNQAVLGDNNQATQQNQVGDGAEASLTKDDIVKLLAELETLIRGAEIPAQPKQEAIEDLSAAKNATDKEEPNKTRALARLDSVAETLEKTSKTVDSGKKLWGTAKPIIVKVASWLGAVAGSHLLG